MSSNVTLHPFNSVKLRACRAGAERAQDFSVNLNAFCIQVCRGFRAAKQDLSDLDALCIQDRTRSSSGLGTLGFVFASFGFVWNFEFKDRNLLRRLGRL